MKRFNLLFMLATSLVPLTSFASDQVQVELVPASSTVHAGSRVTVGLRQHIAAGWHTYWRNPGDSGLPTSVDWKLPSNVTAGGLQWPAPSRFTQGGLVNFGYEREVTLLTTLQVDSKATVGQPLPIEAHVKWLVCRDTCLPQEATLHATLTVSDTTAGGAQRDAIAGLENDLWPHRADWLVQAVRRPHQWTLRLPDGAGTPASAYFYPDEAGVIDPHGPQSVALEQGQHLLKLTPGDTPLRAGQPLSGTLVLQTPLNGQTVTRAYAIDTPLLEAPLPLAAAPSPAVQEGELRGDLSLVPALALALLGGLILNLMPCVFPVLSIKALSMLSHSFQSGHQRRMHGLAYTAGVLVSFAALAAMLLLLRAGGKQAGWGFQFQSPSFVMFVAYLMFGVGLNLAGLFSVGSRLTGMGSSLVDRGGYAGSFFTGVLATIVATPCTAPFMGGAIGYALTQPALPMVLIFESLGLGLALPYLILSLWPALQRWLPRPGLWMERLKQFLAFPMFGAAVWLVWVLTQQAGSQ
ncbi:MAG TPA: protein-disulfide reductase DsbD domain-containing protein, partial [Aquabacterium sp.]|nr:protein-disulfide reductase DsbD domain-containing protein [Aquabacterium sp.]